MADGRGKGMKVWFCCLAAVAVLALAGISEAGVTLGPRVDASGAITGGEDCVLFGRYRHASFDAVGRYRQEARATPVLWRVMETDRAATPARATLLSHHLLDAMALCGDLRESPPGSGKWVRGGTADPANRWESSEIRAWLNAATTAKIVRDAGGKRLARAVEGFLHPDRFAARERAALLPYPGEGSGGATLPSLYAEGYAGNWYDWKYGGELARWFGPNDHDGGAAYGPGSIARRAHFKGAAFVPGSAGSFGWPYWTRSPAASTSRLSCFVDADGTLGRRDANLADAGVRPALSLNLDALIFKSPSDAFDPATLGFTPSGRAGGRSNPFLLYAATGTLRPTGVTVDGSSLTIRFDRRIAHAWADTKSERALGGLFIVKKGTHSIPVERATVSGDAVTLTLRTPLESGEGVTVAYAYAAGQTDGIGFLDDTKDHLPTVWKGLGISSPGAAGGTR